MQPLIGVREVARYLGTTEGHVRELARKGEITSIKVGGLVRFSIEALNDYIVANTREAI